jgi:LAO/AO transport system kinase
MNDVGMDSGVFIRSMATRGSLGGLSRKAIDAADILDAAGFDIIILETVGVGQSELDIAQATDTTIVVLVPESGDSVQAMKAGLMEIADLFVLNKCDRPGSQQAYTALQTILMIKEHDENTWIPKILKAVASENKGIQEIADEIESHKNFLIEKNFFQIKRQSQTKLRIKEIVESKLREKLWSEEREILLNSSLEKVLLGNTSPYHIAEEILHQFVNTKQ